MSRILRLTLTALLVVTSAAAAQADPLVVTTSPTNQTTAANLTASIVASNPGFVVTSSTYTGSAGASGTFSGGTGILGFENGIVLTTGTAGVVVGPNNIGNAGTNNGAAGTPLISDSFNAAILSITFVPTGNQVFFNYVFGSEEYNEFVGSQFNDAFRFLVNDVNYAFIPGTNTPVEINNVNNTSNSQFFRNNTGATINTQLDGLTTVFSFSAPVNPGVANTLQIVIADRGDSNLDSAVFIQAGTFSTQPPSAVPEPATMLLLGTGIAGVAAKVRRRRKTSAPDEN